MIKLLISANKASPVEFCLTRIADLLGAEIDRFSVPTDCKVNELWLEELASAAAVIVDIETVAALLKNNRTILPDLETLAGNSRFFLIYGLKECSATSLRLIFGENRVEISRAPTQHGAQHFSFPGAGAAISRQFAGLNFESIRDDYSDSSKTDSICFKPAPGDSERATRRIIDCDGSASFMVIPHGDCELYLLATSNVLNIDGWTPDDELPTNSYPGLLPWIFFLRRALGERCWHNSGPKACLIIDDPPICPRYGYLSFLPLVEAMRRRDFKTSIAFIPWNFARSTTSATDLFRRNSGALSLSVHGCDHTAGEFGSNDVDHLRRKAHLALERMRLHEEATGLSFDPVMVFPQGIFSSHSLIALQREGYLAAVNCGILAGDRPGASRIADLLSPASLIYGGVPLFNRHSPRSLLPFALDLFLGKQVLIMEHHTYFRSGYDEPAQFAQQLGALEPCLSWAPLGETLRSAVQRRVTDSGVELRAYTDEIFFRHSEQSPNTGHYRLLKYETDVGSVYGVTVNGRPTKFRAGNHRIELDLETQGECKVQVLRRKADPLPTFSPGWKYTAKTATRRYLSTLRDNGLAGNVRWLPASIVKRMTGNPQ